MPPEILSDLELMPDSVAPAPSQTSSTVGKPNGKTDQTVKDDRETIKALLAEARSTKTVLEDFETAVKNGSYQGHQMMALAKGLSFVAAILAQNKAHVINLQERLEKK